MRSLLAPVLAVALTASSAFAETPGPLPAGKPAGVHQANLAGGGFFLILGIAAVAAGVALAVSNNNNNGPTTATTTTV